MSEVIGLDSYGVPNPEWIAFYCQTPIPSSIYIKLILMQKKSNDTAENY